MSFEVGSLVRARGREWIVLPDSQPDLLLLKPLSGRDEEITGVLPALEGVESATFALPEPEDAGDYRGARLLREAARLGFRDSAGPFRAFGRIAVEPRHYQLVPLLVALKQDPVRIMIADDVGIARFLIVPYDAIGFGYLDAAAILNELDKRAGYVVDLVHTKEHADAGKVDGSTVDARQYDRAYGLARIVPFHYVNKVAVNIHSCASQIERVYLAARIRKPVRFRRDRIDRRRARLRCLPPRSSLQAR